MKRTLFSMVAAISMVTSAAPPAAAADAETTLVNVAFSRTTKAQALGQVTAALRDTAAAIARNGGDRDARLQHAIALGYRAQLNRSASDAKAARSEFEAILARHPRDAEALLALASWHLCAVADLGSLMAGAALGAKRAEGLTLLDRAIAAGGGRALFPGFGALLKARVAPKDAAASGALAQQAVRAQATTPLDRLMQARAQRLLAVLRAGDSKTTAQFAKRLLPLGQVEE